MNASASRQRFLPAETASLGPRNEVGNATEFVCAVRAADGRQRGRRGRRGVARSSVPTTQPPRYAPGPNGAAWGPTGRHADGQRDLPRVSGSATRGGVCKRLVSHAACQAVVSRDTDRRGMAG